MTLTSEKTEHTPVETGPLPSLSSEDLKTPMNQIIDNFLSRIDQDPDKERTEEELNKELSGLIIFAKQIGLGAYTRSDQLAAFVETVPAASNLINKIHTTADGILDKETLDSESILVVNDLGVAADLTQDKELLKRTLNALADTHDYNLDPLKQALFTAYAEKQPYSTVYRKLKTAKPVIATEVKVIPMSKREPFAPNSEYHWLSTWYFRVQRHMASVAISDLGAKNEGSQHEGDSPLTGFAMEELREILKEEDRKAS